jgi:hypothetical protein
VGADSRDPLKMARKSKWHLEKKTFRGRNRRKKKLSKEVLLMEEKKISRV